MSKDSNISNDHIIQAFARTLQTVRKKRGLSQNDLANTSGVSLRMISDMENGKRQPSLTTLVKLSGGLGISLHELVDTLLQDRI